jgi:hypothetical protein
MARKYLFGVLQVGHGAGNPQDPIIRPGGQADARDCVLHLFLRLGIELAETAQCARRHLGIAVEAEALEPFALYTARGENALADHGRFFRLLILRQLFVLNRRHLDMQIDPVQQRPRNPRQVSLNQRRRARAVMQYIPEIAALAWMRCPFAVSP